MVIVLIIIGYLMLLIASVEVKSPRYSPRELARRLATAPSNYTLDELRYLYNVYIERMRSAITMILFAIITLLAYLSLGIYLALALVILVACLEKRLAQYLFAAKLSNILYHKYEHDLLKIIHSRQGFSQFLFGPPNLANDCQLGSRTELRDLIKSSASALTADERQVLLSGMDFSASKVGESMQPAAEVVSVTADEIVGPLVLDDLFKSGQQVFPVVENSLDHAIGVLEIKELLTLRSKKSQTARDLMTSGVSLIDEQQSLLAALGILLHDSNRLAVVRDDGGQAVGVITLSDIIGRLIGDAR